MPIKMGDKSFGKFEDASKSVQQSKGLPKERADAYVATIDRKQNEAVVDPEQTQSLTTPNADVKSQDTQDLTSPQGSSREAENPNASGQGELSPANPSQDKAEPTNHKKAGEIEVKNEDEIKDEKREKHQGLEYNGESYSKVDAIEYNKKIYVPRVGKAEEKDLDYDDKFWKEAEEDVLELDDDYYVKDAKEQDIDTIPTQQPTTAISTPQLNPTSESIIIKESNGRYKKYNIFEANGQDDSVPKPVEIKEIPTTEIPQGNVTQQAQEPQTKPIEQKTPVEEVVAVEKIIIKENGSLKFKTVFQEVKKKL